LIWISSGLPLITVRDGRHGKAPAGSGMPSASLSGLGERQPLCEA